MLSDWVSFLAYPNLFGIKGFVVVDELYEGYAWVNWKRFGI
jgi:hypothetical protein